MKMNALAHGDQKSFWSGEHGAHMEDVDGIRARRNVLLGYWVGQRMGLSGDALSRYARQMHLADYILQGDQDIILKIQQDFQSFNLSISHEDASRLLRSMHRQSLHENACTD